jgi:hypothetical protein
MIGDGVVLCVSSAVVSLPPPGVLGRHFGEGVLPRCSCHATVGLIPRPGSVKVDSPPDDADAPDNDVPDAKDAPDSDACMHACMSTGGSRTGCDQ